MPVMATKPTKHSKNTLTTSQSLPISLLRAREALMVPVRDMLKDIGLTEQKWRVLRVLEEIGPCEQSKIGLEACLLLPSLTRILRTMEADELVSRQNDPEDRRRSIVVITDKGRDLVTQNMALSERIAAQLEAQLGHRKVEEMLQMLEALQRVKF